MIIHMNDSRIGSLSEIKAFLELTTKVEFKSQNKKETYAWIEEALGKFRYFSLRRKKERMIVRQYLETMTGLSRSQITRLIARKKKTGRILPLSGKRHAFPRRYTVTDIALLAETDKAHEHLSGPATKRIFERQAAVYGETKYQNVARISISHLYNLRETRQYRSNRFFFTRTTPTVVPIGIRKKPEPEGRPGYLRIDTVHQGDLDGEKGVYHINIVDEVTQWEIIGCVEKISEAYLAPLLAQLLAEFPFVILGFHSDNGSEYINDVVAKLLQKLLIAQTKSRPRHSNDNGLAETKNGGIVRKHMGYVHIPGRHAEVINAFYEQHLNVYLNFHRPCGFATDIVDRKGKVKKKYDTYLTPFEKLQTIDHSERYLKPGVTNETLFATEKKKSDNACAAALMKAKMELFTKLTKTDRGKQRTAGQLSTLI